MTNTQWNYLEKRNLFKCDGEVPDVQDWPKKVLDNFNKLGIKGSTNLDEFINFLKAIKCDNEFTDNGSFIKFSFGPKIFYAIAPDLFEWYPYVFSDEKGICHIIVNIKAIGPIRIPVLNKRMDRYMIFKFN